MKALWGLLAFCAGVLAGVALSSCSCDGELLPSPRKRVSKEDSQQRKAVALPVKEYTPPRDEESGSQPYVGPRRATRKPDMTGWNQNDAKTADHYFAKD